MQINIDRKYIRTGGFGDKWKVIANGHRVSFSSNENILKLIVVMAAQLCEYTRKYWIV